MVTDIGHNIRKPISINRKSDFAIFTAFPTASEILHYAYILTIPE